MNPKPAKNILPLALLVVAICMSHATARAVDFVLGEHTALPGTQVVVPVTFQSGAGLASVQFSLNFDPEILNFVSATNGGAGGGFALDWQTDDGRVTVAAVRPDGATITSGNLLYLTFAVNAGSIEGMKAPLAIADISAGGVNARDFAWSAQTAHTDGLIRVVGLTTDTDGNGLPDWWEEKYFGKPTGARPGDDPDADGMSNASEFIAGTSPVDANDVLRLDIHAVSNVGVSFAFKTVAGKHYQIQASQDLLTWQNFGGSFTGDGNSAEISDTVQFTAQYYRVIVTP